MRLERGRAVGHRRQLGRGRGRGRIELDYGPGFVSRRTSSPRSIGALVADFFGLRLRDIPSLKIDRFGLSFHVGSNPSGQARKWYDSVVAAKSYIVPVVP